jgi:D-alanyl-D-alanine carboxypeptidase
LAPSQVAAYIPRHYPLLKTGLCGLAVVVTLSALACTGPAPVPSVAPTAAPAPLPPPARARAEDTRPTLAPVPVEQVGAPTALPTPAPPAPTATPTTPDWLRSAREVALWSGPDGRATRFGVLPPNEFLKPLGPTEGGRLLVYFAGDGGAHAAGNAWVDRDAVVGSGEPPWITTAEGGPAAVAAKALPAAPEQIDPAPPPDVTAASVAIIDDASGEVLFGKQPHAPLAPASITKIATTIVALERGGDPDQRVSVSVSGSAMAAKDGSSIMGLEPGLDVSLRTLLYGMMLPSGNDAAEQVALTLGGSRAQYVEWMNQKVADLHLQDTHFVTPSGMDASGHYSSAYDMAMLARYAMHNPDFRAMAGAATYHGDGFSFSNLNRLIGAYPGVDGVKIGFTGRAHRTMVASVTRDGHRVYVGLMRSDNLVGDGRTLLDWVLRSFRWS